MPDSWTPYTVEPAHANPCDFCASRGWGIRSGFVRRCEVCCRFRDDHAARYAAQPELTRFALRELPTAHVPPDTGAMRCPWCDHLPTNEDIDTFWQIADATTYARARVGYRGPERAAVPESGVRQDVRRPRGGRLRQRPAGESLERARVGQLVTARVHCSR